MNKKNAYICILKTGKRSGINRGVAQLASVLAWGARGRKFESSHPDLEKQGFQVFWKPFFITWYTHWHTHLEILAGVKVCA
jgi:hypothetical protein